MNVHYDRYGKGVMTEGSITGRVIAIIICGLIGLFFWPLLAVAAFMVYALNRDLANKEPDAVSVRDARHSVTKDSHNWRAVYLSFCESPAETAFLNAMIDGYGLVPERGTLKGCEILLEMQVPIGRYRADFLINRKLVIEVDGAAYHSSPEAKARDDERDKRMKATGYQVFRIPAKIPLFSPERVVGVVKAGVITNRTVRPEDKPPAKHRSLLSHTTALVKDAGKVLNSIGEGAASINRFVEIKRETDKALVPLVQAIANEGGLARNGLSIAKSKVEIDRMNPTSRKLFDEASREMDAALARHRCEKGIAAPVEKFTPNKTPPSSAVKISTLSDDEIQLSVSRQEASVREKHGTDLATVFHELNHDHDLAPYFWSFIEEYASHEVLQSLRAEQSSGKWKAHEPPKPVRKKFWDDDVPF